MQRTARMESPETKGEDMSLWDHLLAGRDPTRQWIADPRTRIELDLDCCSLCGIRLNQPVENLSRLGPPDNLRPTHYEVYEYRKLGFSFDADRGVITAFTVIFRPNDTTPGMTGFSGTVLHAGRKIPLDSDTSEEQFVAEFGSPYWREEEDDGEILDFYESGRIEWQAEFCSDKTLDVLVVTTTPTLADPEQRQYFKVDKPWPPRS